MFDKAEMTGVIRSAIVNEYARQVHHGGYADGIIDFDGLANAAVESLIEVWDG